MSDNRVVVWGASGHALIVMEIIRLGKVYNIIGYIDDITKDCKGTAFMESTIIGGREVLRELKESGIRNIIIGFGDCRARITISEYVKEFGFSLIRAIHPSSVISVNVSIGNGSVIAAGSIIDPFVSIGESVIINNGANIGHESIIRDGTNIAPGVNLSGNVTVGRGTFVGAGSTIIERINIGSNVVIGAGSVVVHDVPDNVVAYGVPARVIKKLEI